MTPDEVVLYFDDPVHAASMCDLLMRTYPDWIVSREDRMWKGRRKSWPADEPSLASPLAGLLNRVIHDIEARGGQPNEPDGENADVPMAGAEGAAEAKPGAT